MLAFLLNCCNASHTRQLFRQRFRRKYFKKITLVAGVLRLSVVSGRVLVLLLVHPRHAHHVRVHAGQPTGTNPTKFHFGRKLFG
jgi:hypothetical protein